MNDSNSSKRSYRIAFSVILALHLALIIYSFPLDVVLGNMPYSPADYQTHYHQTNTLISVLSQFGKTWAYDPNFLAGHPVGLIFDVDNKAYFLFTYLLTRAEIPQAVAYNLFPFISSILAPLCIFFAARLFKLGHKAALISFGFGVLLWHFDSTSRFCWSGGMISFSTVSYGSLMVLALFYRMITEKNTMRFFIPLLILLPLTLLTHVWAFGILVVPLVGLYICKFRSLDRAAHISVWALAFAGLAFNWFWLWPSLKHIHLISPSAKVGQANPFYIFSDYLELLINPVNTGFVFQRTFFRFAAICGAFVSILQWRKEKDPRFFISMLTLCWLFGLSYFAALVPVLNETEPYRFMVPAVFASGIFAGPWFSQILSWKKLTELPRFGQVIIFVLSILLIPRGINQILSFLPEMIPFPSAPQLPGPEQAFINSYKPATPPSFKMHAVSKDMQNLAQFVNEHCNEEGRILVQVWALAEFLRWATDKSIVGGFPDRRLIHEAANIFRYTIEDPRFSKQGFADYLVRYNIRYVVMTLPFYPMIENRTDLLEPMKIVAQGHRVYRVRHFGNYFARGTGNVTAKLNRIEVKNARPAPNTNALLLRFHYMETLRCYPNCKIEKAKIPYDESGFISVLGQPKLPENFVIEHVY